MAEIAEDLTDESNLSMRKRRRSFILASERICSHDYMVSRSLVMIMITQHSRALLQSYYFKPSAGTMQGK